MNPSTRTNITAAMSPTGPYNDVSEDNKENLPPWLLERRESIWAQERAALAAQVPTPRQVLRALRLRKPEKEVDEDLAARIANISISGRGGGPYLSSTLPIIRPKGRGAIPEEFRFEVFNDGDEPVFEDPTDTPEEAGFEIFSDEPLPPVEEDHPVVAAAAEAPLVLSAIRTRPRALTFPGGQEQARFLEVHHGGFQIPVRAPMAGLGARLVVENLGGRRVQSMTVQPSPLLEIDTEYPKPAEG